MADALNLDEMLHRYQQVAGEPVSKAREATGYALVHLAAARKLGNAEAEAAARAEFDRALLNEAHVLRTAAEAADLMRAVLAVPSLPQPPRHDGVHGDAMAAAVDRYQATERDLQRRESEQGTAWAVWFYAVLSHGWRSKEEREAWASWERAALDVRKLADAFSAALNQVRQAVRTYRERGRA